MASMSISNITSTSFSASVIGLDTSYERNDRTVTWYLNGKNQGTSSLSAFASSTSNSFSGLTSNTDYDVSAHIRYSSTATSGLDQIAVVHGSCKTKPGSVTPDPDPDPKPERPSKFYWDTAKTSGAKFNLSASEWNRLISNINSVRSYLGYSNASFTKAVAGNTFTAAMYNQALSALTTIKGYQGTTSAALSGMRIYASALNALRDGVNSLG